MFTDDVRFGSSLRIQKESTKGYLLVIVGNDREFPRVSPDRLIVYRLRVNSIERLVPRCNTNRIAGKRNDQTILFNRLSLYYPFVTVLFLLRINISNF